MSPYAPRIADLWLSRSADSAAHVRSIALMRFLSRLALRLGRAVAENVYVVGGAVRDFVLDRPIKDIDVVIDSVSLGRDSEWFARQISAAIPARTTLVTNNYGVAILTISESWVLEGVEMQGEVIEIANARTESYGGASGKGYKPSEVAPARIEDDVARRELSYNTLMIRLLHLADGPDKADILDLTGCGLSDLEAGIMRCPADPNIVFSDDPSRMIRVIKFALRYGHRLTEDTRAAILNNAEKIKNIPGGHLINLLTGIILREATWKEALQWMQDLNLLAPIREMVLSDEQLKTSLINHIRGYRLEMLFSLMELGLPVGYRVRFLSRADQSHLRDSIGHWPAEEAWGFVEALRNPGVIIQDKKFFPELAREHGFLGPQIAGFNREVYLPIARRILMGDPHIRLSPARFRREIADRVRARLRR